MSHHFLPLFFRRRLVANYPYRRHPSLDITPARKSAQQASHPLSLTTRESSLRAETTDRTRLSASTLRKLTAGTQGRSIGLAQTPSRLTSLIGGSASCPRGYSTAAGAMSVEEKARQRRRFLPIDPERAAEVEGLDEWRGVRRLDGVVFDVDGTLCEPQTYMFAEMRSALNIPKSTDILHHISSLPTASARAAAHSTLRAIESRAMLRQTPSPGLSELMAHLERRGIRKGICTRNFDAPVTHLLEKFVPDSVFHPIVTREFTPPKPDPAGILHIAERWGLKREDGVGKGEGLIMVGDSIDDMAAGRRAGAATVLLVNDVNETLREHENTDLCINRLDDLIQVLDQGFDLQKKGNENE